ncbi:MAG: hypothetical protein LBK60_03585 [Verrucomicrobiales bacterium]|jgi:hypothetical protein|nr:hypothetical protein [Verrucomicrobiales bacterium]
MIFKSKIQKIDWLAGWILLSVCATVSGWTLSAIGCLNRGSYLIVFALMVIFLTTKGKSLLLADTHNHCRWRAKRFRCGLPLLWLALTVLIFIGGALYSPSNFDYLSYRLPRVLNWLWEEKWFWISTANPRLNYSGTGSEWLISPLFAFTNSDRLFFLINFLPWLLLPGLVFSVFTKLGIGHRVSRWWMWLLPSGYCFVTQAGSMGNDAFAAIYALGALHYALMMSRVHTRAAALRCLCLSCLAIALLTGVKLSNAPLALPWLVLFIINWRRYSPVPRPLAMTALFVSMVLASFLPVTYLNIRHTGHYSGEPTSNIILHNPAYGIIGNALQITTANLAPPICPVNISVEKFLPAKLEEKIEANFPRFELTIGELAIEESAAAGLGIMLTLILMLSIRSRSTLRMNFTNRLWITALLLALLVLMAKMGNAGMPRTLTPYYPLLIAAALLFIKPRGQNLERLPWKILVTLIMGSSMLITILSPMRPLFPATLTMNWLQCLGAPPVLTDRAKTVYTTYANRNDAFSEIHRQIPPTERTLAIIQQGDDTITSFWRPFGSRRVVEVTVSASKEELSKQDVRYVAVNSLVVDYQHLAELQNQWDAELVWQGSILDKIQRGEVTWWLLKLSR